MIGPCGKMSYQYTMVIYVIRMKDGSKDSDFKDAAQVCLPLINAALADIAKGTFPTGCLLNIGVPSSPSANKVTLLIMLWILSSIFLVNCNTATLGSHKLVYLFHHYT